MFLAEAAVYASVFEDCRGQFANVDAVLVESFHLLDVQVQDFHAPGGDALDLALLVDKDEGDIRTDDLLVDLEEGHELGP